jgi:hypothetical protein
MWKKKPTFEERKEALKKAAEDYNRKSSAQKKASSRWGQKDPKKKGGK